MCWILTPVYKIGILTYSTDTDKETKVREAKQLAQGHSAWTQEICSCRCSQNATLLPPLTWRNYGWSRTGDEDRRRLLWWSQLSWEAAEAKQEPAPTNSISASKLYTPPSPQTAQTPPCREKQGSWDLRETAFLFQGENIIWRGCLNHQITLSFKPDWMFS